ncbi:hypothetical protein SteCoe_20180 [Stentor coeruleus]|uniref:Uncharacterized protein n=1 Tax=Stentor coeruleus TaxID=5963 RepID=A0A1R2BSG4_9CILI|nr:hypothetical protein SteCoe_20180 [Stentor coeruleus]
MRKNVIAIRIPRRYTNYNRIPANIIVQGLQEQIHSLSPKARIQQSKDYKRSLTPLAPTVHSSYVNKSISTTPNFSSSKSKIAFRSLKLDRGYSHFESTSTSISSANYLNQKTIIKKAPLKIEDKFDLYAKETQTAQFLAQEHELFPESLNENLQYLPEPGRFTFLYNNCNKSLKSKSLMRSEKGFKGLKWLITTPTTTKNLSPNFIRDNKMIDLFPKIKHKLKTNNQ